MAGVLVVGETLIDLLPSSRGPLADIEGFNHQPGGAPANVAVGLAKLGNTPRFWTQIAGDAFGDYLEDVLTKQGIQEQYIQHREETSTSLAVVNYDEHSEQNFEFYGDGAGTFDFRVENIPTEALETHSWVHFGGTALINTYGAGTMLELAKRANEQGCTVSFDPNIRPALIPEDDSNRVADALTQALDLADIVVCSPDDLELLEAEMATGAALAEWLLSQGPHTAFVTLGSDGAVVSSSDAAPWGESAATHPGFDLNTVDTTGAGDSFASAIITRLVEDSEPSMDTVLRFANATAALTTRTQGGLSALPSRQEVRQFWE